LHVHAGVALELLEGLAGTQPPTLDCVQLLKAGTLGSLGTAAAGAVSAEEGGEVSTFQPASPELAFIW